MAGNNYHRVDICFVVYSPFQLLKYIEQTLTHHSQLLGPNMADICRLDDKHLTRINLECLVVLVPKGLQDRVYMRL